MWVLDSHCGELHYFVSPEDIPGGYAILSHVWGDNEQSFQELKDLVKECAANGTRPRDHASEKIKRSCELAERHKIKWIWNDTCCINKASSAELSEAINSMFRYYSLAQACYIYLHDVPPDDTPHHPDSVFRKSKWHSRGWTLQELLAPAFALFLSYDWGLLGSKADLAPLLHEVSRIPTSVLLLERDMMDVSIAERMSWAASRKTTRPEDEAYCLMGIFGINMAPLYGEGSREAFWRLQEEIMKNSMDTSLFAWGAQFPSDRGPSTPSRVVPDLHPAPSESPPSPPPRNWDSIDTHFHPDEACLLAPSVSFFKNCDIVPSDRKLTADKAFGLGFDMHTAYGNTLFFTTPYGIGAQAILLFDASSCFGTGVKVAILDWHREGQHLGLLLTECRSLYAADSLEPLYDIGTHGFRLVPLGPSQDVPSFFGKPIIPTRQDMIYLLHRPSDHDAMVRVRAPTTLVSFNLRLSSPFRISQRHIDALSRSAFPIELQSATEPCDAWDGSEPVILVFKLLKAYPPEQYLTLHLGRCTHAPSSSGGRGPGEHWAKVLQHDGRRNMESALGSGRPANLTKPNHTCDDDHIVRWPGGNVSSSFFKQITLKVTTTPGLRTSVTLTLSFTSRPTRLCNTFVGSLGITT